MADHDDLVMQFCELTGASADRVWTERLFAKLEKHMVTDSLTSHRLRNTSRLAVGTSPLLLVPFSPTMRMRLLVVPAVLLSLHRSPHTAAPERSMADPPPNPLSPPPVLPPRNPPRRRDWPP